MNRIEVKTSLRKRRRELKNALGDDILRYIAELVTNADDSYKRLKDDAPEEKIIIIELQEDSRNKDGGYMLSVTDNAEGMTLDRLEKVFSTYGEDNASGMSSSARGIFGQGASDVLQAAAKEQRTAKIETIKDGIVSKLIYNMDEDLHASINTESLNLSGNRLQQYRESISIPNNGTKVIFGIPSNVKFTKKIINSLPDLINKYPSFRYLLNQKDRKVIFIHGKEKTILSSAEYQFDESNMLSDDVFDFKFDGMNVECRLKTYINENKKEDGTNIIVRDEKYIIYDNTMFDFQNNAAAQNISGELVIDGLYQICYNHLNSEDPDAIVRDNRTGFDTGNPFYTLLNKTINPFIDTVIKENSKGIRITNLNNNKKFSDALRKLNKYLKSELKDSIGGGNLTGKEPPKEGIKFARNSITITKDKQYDLKLLINSNLISKDEKIIITCESNNIDFSPSIITFNDTDIVDGLVIKNVTIKGIELTNDSDILQAKTSTRTAIVAIDVIPMEIHYPENGLEFYPNDVTLTANKDHFIKLYVDSEVIPLNSVINLKCDGLDCDENIVFSEKCLLNDTIGALNVVLKGGTIGDSYKVVAEINDKQDSAKITIIEESKNEPQNGGLISGFKLEPSEMFFQSYYDPHTHFIVINNNNPINKKIMGDMSDKNAENPTFNTVQSNYLCDIIANQAATLLVKQKNIKNGEVNFDEFENAVEQVQALIQQQKNKIYVEIYPAIMGKAEEKEE